MVLTEDDVERMFGMGFDCSQIVFSEVSDTMGISKEDALRIASCFGIGMAREGVCGAVTGALMALGLRYGNDEQNDFMTKRRLFDIRDEFVRRFEESNGGSICPELLGTKVHTLEDMIAMKPSGVFSKCPGYCVSAVSILEDML